MRFHAAVTAEGSPSPPAARSAAASRSRRAMFSAVTRSMRARGRACAVRSVAAAAAGSETDGGITARTSSTSPTTTTATQASTARCQTRVTSPPPSARNPPAVISCPSSPRIACAPERSARGTAPYALALAATSATTAGSAPRAPARTRASAATAATIAARARAHTRTRLICSVRKRPRGIARSSPTACTPSTHTVDESASATAASSTSARAFTTGSGGDRRAPRRGAGARRSGPRRGRGARAGLRRSIAGAWGRAP